MLQSVCLERDIVFLVISASLIKKLVVCSIGEISNTSIFLIQYFGHVEVVGNIFVLIMQNEHIVRIGQEGDKHKLKQDFGSHDCTNQKIESPSIIFLLFLEISEHFYSVYFIDFKFSFVIFH